MQVYAKRPVLQAHQVKVAGIVGDQHAEPGDYVVTDAKGGTTVFRPTEFAALFEPVAPEPTPSK